MLSTKLGKRDKVEDFFQPPTPKRPQDPGLRAEGFRVECGEDGLIASSVLSHNRRCQHIFQLHSPLYSVMRYQNILPRL